MKKLTGHEIRQLWLNFFKSKGHVDIGGVSLVPHDDPTLLWINSGVAAIKHYFDGSEVPISKRLTNVQKSIRTNDIENVGYTARHHTFFEMLGNFSIGDYFRKEAIEWAYEILVSEKYFGFDKNKLYMTYNPSDLESRDLWLKQGMASDHLIALEGNYWQIGNGPCGPNTEVFYDRGEKYDPEGLGVELLKQELNNDRYIEIWGIVFSQYNGIEGHPRETYLELPSKNIDTGAGLERLACILQNTPTNFETDLFFPIIQATEKLAKINYENSLYRPYRVIADHIRTLTFALGDQASFSNVGRGYVLRRLLRRALRYGRQIGIEGPFLFRLVPVVIKTMQDYYPALISEQTRIQKMIQAEEEKFLLTLNHGENLLKKIIAEKSEISGEDAFKLYDTYGFPVELSEEIAHEANVKIDLIGFQKRMQEQKDLARSSRKHEGSLNEQSPDLLAFLTPSHFHYASLEGQGKVIGLFKDGQKVEQLSEYGEVILDETVFYAESGGQVADHGFMQNKNSLAKVIKVLKAPHGQHLHRIEIEYGALKVGDKLSLKVDSKKRQQTMRNHTSLHLLQAALLEVLGSHVHQQGSFVSEEYGRFDFTHQGKISEVELNLIESKVNEMIAMAIPRTVDILPFDEAKKAGAISMADEKYFDVVRVVSFGKVSKELCGGTHANNTQDLGVFALVSEESIAAGVRRITVKTGYAAYHFLKQKEQQLNNLKNLLQVKAIIDIPMKIRSLLTSLDTYKIEVDQFKNKMADQIAKEIKPFKKVSFGEVFLEKLEGLSREMLLLVFDRLKVSYPNSLIFLIGDTLKEKALISYVSPSFQSGGYNAAKILKDVALYLEGSGGGKSELAFGSAKNLSRYLEMKEDFSKSIHD